MAHQIDGILWTSYKHREYVAMGKRFMIEQLEIIISIVTYKYEYKRWFYKISNYVRITALTLYLR